MKRTTLEIATHGRGLLNIVSQVEGALMAMEAQEGLCHLFLQHTSASLILCENADPSVLRDLERYFLKLVPDGDPTYEHSAEGPDDMPAHIRTILTQNAMTLPLENGKLAFGIWQGLFLWEHRTAAHSRRLLVTLV